jgi:ubiquitin-conjugating enzyme E2 I
MHALMMIIIQTLHPYLQELLDTPNPNSPAQSDAYVCFTQRPDEYKRKVRKQAAEYPPPT